MQKKGLSDSFGPSLCGLLVLHVRTTLHIPRSHHAYFLELLHFTANSPIILPTEQKQDTRKRLSDLTYRFINLGLHRLEALPAPCIHLCAKGNRLIYHTGQHFKMRKDPRFLLKSDTMATPLHFTCSIDESV